MKRLTYKTVGDALRQPHYCHGPGVKKDDLLQRLGKLEDAIERIDHTLTAERSMNAALREIQCVVDQLKLEVRENA